MRGPPVTTWSSWYGNFMPHKDSDRRREYGREWMRTNPEKAREAMRRWRQRHPAEHAASNRGYYERPKDTLGAYLGQYRRELRDGRQGIHARRRACKAGAEGSYMTVDWIELLQRWNWSCVIAASGALSSLSTGPHLLAAARTSSRTFSRRVGAAISGRRS
jgi:hypothetical protein